jgi:hypothetical protein
MDPLATTPPPEDAETSRPTVLEIPSRRIHGADPLRAREDREHIIQWLSALGGCERTAMPTSGSTTRLSGSQR